MFKVFVAIVISGCTLNFVRAELDCSRIPKTALNNSCCNSPQAFEPTVLEACEEDIEGYNYSEMMKECAMFKCVSEKSGFLIAGKLSKQSILSHLSSEVTQNSKWGPTIAGYVGTCIESTEKQIDHIQKIFSMPPFNISPTECDVAPMVVGYCVDSFMLTKCPKADWNDNSVCKEWREYLTFCNLFDQIATIQIGNVTGVDIK